MSDKTDQLRDLFLKISTNTKVVEKQATQHGTLKGSAEIERALREVVSEMVGRYNVQTKLTLDQLATTVRLFYNELSDTEIAEQLGDHALNKTVSRARIKLQLFRETDLVLPFDKDKFMQLIVAGRSVKETSEMLDVAPSTISEYKSIFSCLKAKEQDGYTKIFEEILSDQEVSEMMVAHITKDGLQDTIDTDYEAAEA